MELKSREILFRSPSRKSFGAWCLCALSAAVGVLAVAVSARALINPRFTPVHLTEQSKQVFLLRLTPPDKKGNLSARLVRCLKGKPPKSLKIDASLMSKEHRELLADILRKNPDQVALLFAGEYEQEGEGGDEGGAAEGGHEIPNALLHVRDKWFAVSRDKNGAWHIEAFDGFFDQTWRGSTVMLRRAVEYVLSAPRPEVPAATGSSWVENEHKKIATLQGRVYGMLGVCVTGGQETYVHILAEKGDRLLRHDKQANQFRDVAGRLKLGARSRVAAWADLDGDGRLDLASWDGRSLALWLQGKDGTFVRTDPGVKPADCIGLAVVGVGEKGRAALVVSTQKAPLLFVPKTGRQWALTKLAPGPWAGAKLGHAHACVVADFTGDGIPDVIQPFEKGALLYAGVSAGGFAAPKPCGPVGTGPGHAVAFTGDYDQDGRLDVFVSAQGGCGLWWNQGNGTFAETIQYAGEMAYISKPDALGGNTCDINNDGRQDVFITYTNMLPQLFFNRGFRSFGHSHSLDLGEKAYAEFQRIADNEEEIVGQQAGLVADLDGDGAQDMIFVLSHRKREVVEYPQKPKPWEVGPMQGEVWVFWRDTGQGDPLGVRAVAPVAGPAGPITVTAWHQKRCLGTWSVTPGTPGAFFGLLESGRCKLRWQFPGHQPRTKTVVVEDEPVCVILKP